MEKLMRQLTVTLYRAKVSEAISAPLSVQDRLGMSNVDAAIGGVFHDAVQCALKDWEVSEKNTVGEAGRFMVEAVGDYFDALWLKLLEKRKKVLGGEFEKEVKNG